MISRQPCQWDITMDVLGHSGSSSPSLLLWLARSQCFIFKKIVLKCYHHHTSLELSWGSLVDYHEKHCDIIIIIISISNTITIMVLT